MKLDRKESTNFTLRMSMDQRLELERIAKKEDRTVTNLINMVLTKSRIKTLDSAVKKLYRKIQWAKKIRTGN